MSVRTTFLSISLFKKQFLAQRANNLKTKDARAKNFRILLQYPAYKEGFKIIDSECFVHHRSIFPPSQLTNIMAHIKLYKCLKKDSHCNLQSATLYLGPNEFHSISLESDYLGSDPCSTTY